MSITAPTASLPVAASSFLHRSGEGLGRLVPSSVFTLQTGLIVSNLESRRVLKASGRLPDWQGDETPTLPNTRVPIAGGKRHEREQRRAGAAGRSGTTHLQGRAPQLRRSRDLRGGEGKNLRLLLAVSRPFLGIAET